MKGITYKSIVVYAVLAFCITLGQAYGKDKMKGLIVSRAGEALTLQTQNSGNVTVLLTADTKIYDTEGKLHPKKDMAVTALVPGLAVEVEADKNEQSKLVASVVKFSPGALKTANAIQAGLTPTDEELKATEKELHEEQQRVESEGQQIQSNQQQIKEANKRFSDLSDYETKAKADVYFNVGSSTISASDKAALQLLASQAVTQTGYLVSVKGFADSTGNPVQNQKLSMERADAVLAYLEQDGKIPLIHIVAPGAMGTADPAATNETAQGRAENRRVEVKVLLNKAMAEK
jgi:outer membrane protein OmpA-like peptidoglycan-associated protein